MLLVQYVFKSSIINHHACGCLLLHTLCSLAGSAGEVLPTLFGPTGLGSSCPGDVSAAQLALGSAMAVSPMACLDPLLQGLDTWLDRKEHDPLTEEDFAVFNTPEGMLSSEVVPEGVYVPEVVVSKNVRKARGRFKVSEACWGRWSYALRHNSVVLRSRFGVDDS